MIKHLTIPVQKITLELGFQRTDRNITREEALEELGKIKRTLLQEDGIWDTNRVYDVSEVKRRLGVK